CWKKCDVFWGRHFLRCAEELLSETKHESLKKSIDSECSRFIKELENIWKDIIKKQKINREVSEKEPDTWVCRIGEKKKKTEAELLLVTQVSSISWSRRYFQRGRCKTGIVCKHPRESDRITTSRQPREKYKRISSEDFMGLTFRKEEITSSATPPASPSSNSDDSLELEYELPTISLKRKR
ncbi:16759_t:CDS:2, partial [Acaulospora morrowiae]